MKKFLCFLSALALLLSALPFQLISLADAAADNSQEKFNLFSANSYYWKNANWSDSNSLANGQLVLYNGIYVQAAMTFIFAAMWIMTALRLRRPLSNQATLF